MASKLSLTFEKVAWEIAYRILACGKERKVIADRTRTLR